MSENQDPMGESGEDIDISGAKFKLMSQICAPVEIIIAFMAIYMNIYIMKNVLKRNTSRRRVSTLLILNQCTVDLFNSVMFVLLNGAYECWQSYHSKIEDFIENIPIYAIFSKLLVFTFTVSVISSVFSFLLVSIERFMAILTPLYHRRNLTRKKLYVCITLVWLSSFAVAGMGHVMLIYFPNKRRIYNYLVLAIIASSSILVSFLFLVTYFKSRNSVRNGNSHNYTSEKEVRLTIIFISMYLIFLLVPLPMTIVLMVKPWIGNISCPIFMGLSSLVNPLLVLKKDLKRRRHTSTVSRTAIEIEMQTSSRGGTFHTSNTR